MAHTRRAERRHLLRDPLGAPVAREPVEGLGAERAPPDRRPGAPGCGLELAHHVRERRVLRHDPGARHAPGVGQGVVARSGWLAAREPGIQRDRGRPRERDVEAGNSLPDRFLPAPVSVAEGDRPADRGGRLPEQDPELLDLRQGRGLPTDVGAGHGQAGDHHHEIAAAGAGGEGGVGPDLVDGDVAGSVAVPGEDSGDLTDVGGDVGGDAEACGLVDIAVDDEGARGHTRSGGGVPPPSRVFPA